MSDTETSGGESLVPAEPKSDVSRALLHRDGTVRHNVLSIALAVYEQSQWEAEGRCQKARLFPFAFKVSESTLKKINQRVLDRLSELESVDELQIVRFKGTVRYQDLSTEVFDDFEQLLEEAAERETDPEQLTLFWKQQIAQPPGAFVSAQVTFTTEKPLDIQELNILEFAIAKMELTTVGPDPSTVSKIYDPIVPFIMSSRLKGVYRPLLVFRNSHVVQITAWFAGFCAMLAFNELVGRYRQPAIDAKKTATADTILNAPDTSSQFENYIRYLFAPSTESSIVAEIAQLAAGWGVLVVTAVLGFVFLPKLCPKSGINIGLAKHRYEDYENAFKLIVFTLLICGILIPIIRSIFF